MTSTILIENHITNSEIYTKHISELTVFCDHILSLVPIEYRHRAFVELDTRGIPYEDSEEGVISVCYERPMTEEDLAIQREQDRQNEIRMTNALASSFKALAERNPELLDTLLKELKYDR